MKKLCKLLALFIALLCLFGCTATKKTKYTEHLIGDEMFDTVIQFILYTEEEDEFGAYTEKVKNEFIYYHKLYDKYHTYPGINNIKTINDSAGIAPVKVEQPIIDLLKFSKEMHEKTSGKTNIALGAVLKIWHDYRERYSDIEEYDEHNTSSKIPSKEELNQLRKNTDISKLIIDEEAMTVFIEDPDMSIDVGGIAKGYATEQVAKMLESEGLEDFVVNAGGNVRVSGYSYGENGKKRLWNTGVKDPLIQSNPSTANIRINSGALVSSGNYERFYWYDGKKYSHIIDDDTLYPSFEYAQVTIYHEDSAIADFLSTELYLLPIDQGKSIAKKFNAEVLWIEPDGTIHVTSDFFTLRNP